MKLFLIRHGQTPLNAQRVFQFPDTPLSERGLEQAARLGERFKTIPVDAILVSDYARAQQTANALHLTTQAPLTVSTLLRERNFGDLRGRAHSELDFDPLSPDYDPPNGENTAVFQARVDKAWQAIGEFCLKQPDGLAVVTHGLVLDAIVQRHLPATVCDRFPRKWQNTAVTLLHGTQDSQSVNQVRWEPQLYACAAHISG